MKDTFPEKYRAELISTGLLLAFQFLCMWYTWEDPVYDFANYYLGAKAILDCTFNISLYDPITFNEYAVQEGYTNLFVSFAPNTPFLAIFFIPFTATTIVKAKIAFNIFSILIFSICSIRMARFLGMSPYYLLVIPIIFFTPILRNIQNGQPYLVIVALICEAFLLLERGRRTWAVLLVAFVSLIKLVPLVVVFYLIAKKYYRSAVVLVVVFCGSYLISFYALDPNLLTWYHNAVMTKVAFGEIVSNGFYIPSQTSIVLMKSLFLYDELLNPQPYFNSPILVLAGISIISGIVLITSYTFTSRNRSMISFSIWFVIIFLVSPYGSSYAKILLVFIFFSFQRLPASTFIPAGLLLMFICNFPYHLLSGLPGLLQFPGWMALMVLMIILTRFSLNWRSARKILALAFIIFGVNYFRIDHKLNKDTYVVPTHIPLVTDYQVQENFLTFHRWNGKVQLDSIKISDQPVRSIEPLRIQDNQIMINGSPVSTTRDNKMNAILVDSTKIFYLTDAGRGYGFYTLRQKLLEDIP